MDRDGYCRFFLAYTIAEFNAQNYTTHGENVTFSFPAYGANINMAIVNKKALFATTLAESCCFENLLANTAKFATPIHLSAYRKLIMPNTCITPCIRTSLHRPLCVIRPY
ncbi:hypothetical protein FKM82_020226 [Ascaphus truei]